MRELDPERARQLLATRRYGRSLAYLAQTGSTNDDARLAAGSGAASGHTIVADEQTQGRGSSGRSWSSSAGSDIYASIVDRPALGLAELPPLTLAVGLGVAEAIEQLIGAAGCQVKWPNDVLLGGRKCAGILVEASSSGPAVDWVVIGIGLNVNREAFPDELSELATSLRREQPGRAPFDRTQVLATLLGSVERQVDRFLERGPGEIVAALAPRLALVGERARCGELEGVVRGVTPGGALRFETEAGVRELYSGRLVAL